MRIYQRSLREELSSAYSKPSAVKLSDRNVSDLVLILLKEGTHDIIVSEDGIEYLTKRHLRKEIEKQVDEQGGRIWIPNLPKILNVNFSWIEQALPQVSTKDLQHLLSDMYNIVHITETNELMTKQTVFNLAEEFESKLQQSNFLSYSSFASHHKLPISFTTSIVKIFIGSIIHGELDMESGMIFIEGYRKTLCSVVFASLLAITRPTPKSKILLQNKDVFYTQSLLEACLDTLKQENRLNGTFTQPSRGSPSLYLPNIFLQARINWIESVFKRDGVLSIAMMEKLELEHSSINAFLNSAPFDAIPASPHQLPPIVTQELPKFKILESCVISKRIMEETLLELIATANSSSLICVTNATIHADYPGTPKEVESLTQIRSKGYETNEPNLTSKWNLCYEDFDILLPFLLDFLPPQTFTIVQRNWLISTGFVQKLSQAFESYSNDQQLRFKTLEQSEGELNSSMSLSASVNLSSSAASITLASSSSSISSATEGTIITLTSNSSGKLNKSSKSTSSNFGGGKQKKIVSLSSSNAFNKDGSIILTSTSGQPFEFTKQEIQQHGMAHLSPWLCSNFSFFHQSHPLLVPILERYLIPKWTQSFISKDWSFQLIIQTLIAKSSLVPMATNKLQMTNNQDRLALDWRSNIEATVFNTLFFLKSVESLSIQTGASKELKDQMASHVLVTLGPAFISSLKPDNFPNCSLPSSIISILNEVQSMVEGRQSSSLEKFQTIVNTVASSFNIPHFDLSVDSERMILKTHALSSKDQLTSLKKSKKAEPSSTLRLLLSLVTSCHLGIVTLLHTKFLPSVIKLISTSFQSDVKEEMSEESWKLVSSENNLLIEQSVVAKLNSALELLLEYTRLKKSAENTQKTKEVLTKFEGVAEQLLVIYSKRISLKFPES